MSSSDIAIEINNLGKMYKLYKNPNDKIRDAFGLNAFKKNYYKEFWALRDVNIVIKKGERVGFIGHNGAGKSTLLKIITGNYKPTEGNVNVNGQIQALLEMGTGFHPDFTGRQNIRASLAYQGLPQKEIERLEKEIIDFTELDQYIEQPVKTYSAGMYSRLAFATASAVTPELMIIDEILGAGDAYFNGKCVERMRKLTQESGATVLFVSHDLQSVQNLCDRVIWIDKGKVRYDGEVLTGIKLYTQSVRKNEELRLKIRDMKVSKAQALAMDLESDLYDSYIYRFVGLNELKDCKFRLYQIKVLADGEEIDKIAVGDSMDNNIESNAHIIDEVGMTCWGKPQRDHNGYYRQFVPEIGIDKHIPFRVAINKAFEKSKIEMDIEFSLISGDMELQLFSDIKSEYVNIVELHSSDSIQSCNLLIRDKSIEDVINEEENPSKEEVVDDIIFTDIAQINNVSLHNEDGEERNVFPFNKSVSDCRFDLLLKKALDRVIVSVCVYSMRGDLVLSTCQEVRLKEKNNELKFIYPFDRLVLGPGEYTLSIGVYEDLDVTDNSREQPFIALFDRALSFSIEKPLQYALNLGTIVPNEKLVILDKTQREYECNFMI